MSSVKSQNFWTNFGNFVIPNEQSSTIVNGQILKNNFAIWSHCSRVCSNQSVMTRFINTITRWTSKGNTYEKQIGKFCCKSRTIKGLWGGDLNLRLHKSNLRSVLYYLCRLKSEIQFQAFGNSMRRGGRLYHFSFDWNSCRQRSKVHLCI